MNSELELFEILENEKKMKAKELEILSLPMEMLCNETKKALKKYSNFDFIFGSSEINRMKKVITELKYWYIEKQGFFYLIQPYHFVLSYLLEQTKKRGYIYFIKDEKNGLTKIGRSINVNQRIKDFAISSNNLKVLKTIKVNNAPYCEKKLHKHFENKNVFKEWFKLNPKEIKSSIALIEGL